MDTSVTQTTLPLEEDDEWGKVIRFLCYFKISPEIFWFVFLFSAEINSIASDHLKNSSCDRNNVHGVLDSAFHDSIVLLLQSLLYSFSIV